MRDDAKLTFAHENTTTIAGFVLIYPLIYAFRLQTFEQ